MTHTEYAALFFAFCILFSTIVRLFLIAKKKNKNIDDLFKAVSYFALFSIPAFIFTVMYFEHM